MRKFLYKILLYVVLFALFAFMLQNIIDRGLRNYDDDMYIDWNRIFRGQIKADIIIIGSSRAYVHFSPQIIEVTTNLSSYNLAVNGSAPLTQKSKLDFFLANNPAPKILIQNVDIFLLLKERHIFEKEQFFPYLNQPSISEHLKKIDSNIWLENTIPLYKYRGFRNIFFLGLQSYLGLLEKPQVNKYKGYAGVDAQWNQDFSKFKEENSELVYNQENLIFGFNYLKDLITEYKKKNIEIILVQSPLYFELQNIMPQKDSITNRFSEIANKSGIQFWDYYDDSLCINKKYFYNSTHLNKLGSEIFSKQLAVKLKNYLVDNPIKFSFYHEALKNTELKLNKNL